MMLRLTLLAVACSVALASSRLLEDNMSWMKGYSVLYENCFHSNNLVTFRLCPASSSCSSGCEHGGEYLVDLSFFVDAFTEAQLGAREYRCEMIRENCNDDDGAACYEANGADYCEDNGEEFDVQEYLECVEVDDGLYVGPYCAENNYDIYLGVYTDEYCTAFAEDGAYESAFGYSLDFSEVSIVSDECARCREHALQEDKDEGDADDDDDVLEQCENLYAESSKCEDEYLDVEYPDSSSCSYIKELQAVENIDTSALSGGTVRRQWGMLIGIFVACCVLVVLIGLYTIRKKSRRTVDLAPAKENLM